MIQATLISLVDKTSFQLQAVPVKKGVYSIEYIPKVRGRHHLQISVDGQPITEVPLSLSVKIHPVKLDEPVVKIGRFRASRHTAFLSSEELVVTDKEEDVVFLNKKGERVRSISKSRFGFMFVWGVAVDKDDNIYVSDSNAHCVYKFSKSGEQLKRFGKYGSGPGEFNCPRGVAVAGDQVFVCDKYKYRVQVLTTELEPVTWFGSKGAGDGQFNYPVDVAVDNDGMLYVSDSNNHRVQVFTRDGQFFLLIWEERKWTNGTEWS